MRDVRLFDDLSVSRETIDMFEVYIALLRKWSGSINLVSRSTLHDVWDRHVRDSAQIYPLLPENCKTIVDFGSGAGFPGLVLAILAQDAEWERPFDVLLVESDRRKALFLREVIREIGLDASVMVQRVETLDVRADVITARGFTALDKLLALAHPLIGSDGIAILHKGARYESELTEAARSWHMDVERFPSRTDPASAVLRIGDLKRRQDET